MGQKRAERPIAEISEGSQRLSGLLKAARAFDALEQALAPHIPETMRGHIRVACIDGDCLVIAAASPAWASRARLMADQLLAEARRHVPDRLARAKVIVVPPG